MSRLPALLMLLSVAACSGRSFEFAAIGDLPYGGEGWTHFPYVVSSLNAADVEWVLHVGDIKSGSAPCSDSLITARYRAFQDIRHPFVFAPGDNEWTDCHREAAGGYDPLDRLRLVRDLFFSELGQTSGSVAMAVESQATDPEFAEFPEHQRWVREGVVFVVLNVVGSNNGLAPFEGRTDAHDAEVLRREEAAVTWIRESFELARLQESPGVVLAFQANPFFPNPFPPDGSATPDELRIGFENLIETIEAETISFGRPVLLVHGDTHYFRIDKPLFNSANDRRLENFTRLEVFGAPDFHWVRVRVDPDDPGVFSFGIELIEANIRGYD